MRIGRQSAWWLGAAGVLGALALYYGLFHFPPRLVGSNDPDRYFHLALARIVAEGGGWPRMLPQVENLGWGRYFPDKEFLFHALGGVAWKIGGPVAVNLLVPLLGIAIGLAIYASLARALPATKAALLAVLPMLLFPAFLFRVTLLRPHLLAILFFCLLLHALLSRRRWLAAGACAGFALSYHALYIPMLAVAFAALLLREPGRRVPTWAAATLGLLAGIVCNPYFPDTLVWTWSIIKIALSVGMPPGLVPGNELLPLSLREYLYFFAALPLAFAVPLLRSTRAAAGPSDAHRDYLFLLAVTGALVLLSFRSARATEYAIPAATLLLGHWWRGEPSPRLALGALLVMALVQFPCSRDYLRDSWTLPQGGDTPLYFNALARLPAAADGKKIFTCEWQTGSYILYARPRMRFVDLLDPALLWQFDPQRYRLRQALSEGRLREPWRALREGFDADYVVCADALDAQMAADPAHFEELREGPASAPLRVFRLREDKQ